MADTNTIILYINNELKTLISGLSACGSLIGRTQRVVFVIYYLHKKQTDTQC